MEDGGHCTTATHVISHPFVPDVSNSVQSCSPLNYKEELQFLRLCLFSVGNEPGKVWQKYELSLEADRLNLTKFAAIFNTADNMAAESVVEGLTKNLRHF